MNASTLLVAVVLGLVQPASDPAVADGTPSVTEEDFDKAAQLLHELYRATEDEGEGYRELIELYEVNLAAAREVGSKHHEAEFAFGVARSWYLFGEATADPKHGERAARQLDTLIEQLEAQSPLDHFRRTILSDALALRVLVREDDPPEGQAGESTSPTPTEGAPVKDPARSPAPTGTSPDHVDTGPRPSKLPVALISGGAVLTAGGIVFVSLGVAGEKIAEASGKDPDHSEDEFWNERLPRRRLGWIVSGSIVGAVGIAGVVAGAILLERSKRGVAFTPLLGPTVAGFGVAGRF